MAMCHARASWWQVGLGYAVLLLVPSFVQAQPTAARDSGEYRELIRRALQEYDLGNWSEAKLLFSDAHALYPNARTLRGLGLTAYESRNYVEAIGFLEQSLANQVQPLSGDLRSALSKLLEQARHFVGRVQTEIEPSSAELKIDEQPVKRGPDGIILLDPGQHELTATASGYDSVRRRVTVDAGARVRVQLQLPLKPASESGFNAALQPRAAGAPPPPADAASSSSRSMAPWIVVGAGAAVAIAGSVLLAITSSDLAKVDDAPRATEWSSVQSAYDRTPILSAAGYVLLGAGVLGAAAGLTWEFWPEHERKGIVLRVSPSQLSFGAAL
jgi:tetratricopeptide (TPR) repeat protein